MDKETIERAANDWADNFDTSDPTFAKIKRQTAEISYRKGAEMVNYRQPYSAEDMKAFAIYCRAKLPSWIVSIDDELIKLWEESK